MQDALLEVFSDHNCGVALNDTCRVTSARRLRCGSKCLSTQTIKESFIFTFVRDPVERFYSGLHTAVTRTAEDPAQLFYSGLHTASTHQRLTREDVEGFLHRVQRREGKIEEHLQSQALSLSAPISTGARIPLDFIGRSEHLVEDFELLLDQAARFTRRKLGASQRAQLLGLLLVVQNARDRTPVANDIQRIRDEKLDTLVTQTYSQDMACFSFDHPGPLP